MSAETKAKIREILTSQGKGSSADTLLEKYKGKEDALLNSLSKLPGGATAAAPASAGNAGKTASPAAAVASAARGPADVEQTKAKIRDILTSQGKGSAAPALLEKYKGKEEALLTSLGGAAAAAAAASPASPAASASSPAAGGGGVEQTKAKIREILTSQGKGSSADMLLEKYKGKEEALLKSLEKLPSSNTSSASPSVAPAEKSAVDAAAQCRQILRTKQNLPDAKINAMLDNYKGKEEQLLKALQKQDTAVAASSAPSSPASPAAAAAAKTASPAAAAASAASAPADIEQTKAKIRDILTSQGRGSAAPALLEKYKGKEEALLKSLGGAAAAAAPSSPASPVAAVPSSSPVATAPGAAAAAGGGEQKLISDVLATHNALRAKHGAAPLTWSAECAQFAAKCAAESTRNKKMTHGNADGPSGAHGQNIFFSDPPASSVLAAIQQWYSESVKPGYDFTKDGGAQKGTGHFTQVVWAATKQVGCAINGNYIVCNYFPAGNYAGKYMNNVKAASSSSSSSANASPAPTASQAAAPPSASSSPSSHDVEQAKRRIREILNAQGKGASAEAMLEKYKGKESALLQSLEKLPGASAAASASPSSPIPASSSPAAPTSPAPAAAAAASAARGPADVEQTKAKIRDILTSQGKGSAAPALLEKYKGKEEALLKSLGGAAAAAASPASPAAQTQSATTATPTSTFPAAPAALADEGPAASPEEIRRRVKALLQHYAPDKAANAGQLLSRYSGKEHALLLSLVKSYGPEPKATASPPPSQPTSGGGQQQQQQQHGPVTAENVLLRVTAIMIKYSPDKVANVPGLVERYKDDPAKLIAALTKTYGPEPAPGEVDIKAFFSSPPSSAAGAGAASGASSPTTLGSPTFSASDNNNNKKNNNKKNENDAAASAAASAPNGMSIDDRIRAIILYYKPELASNVTALMGRYKGSEDKLLASLVKSYGPEPHTLDRHAERSPPPAAAATAPVSPPQQQQTPISPTQQQQPPASSVSSFPSSPTSAVPPSAAQSASPLSHLPLKERIRRLIAQYDPARISQTDALLQRFAGKEAQLLDSMIRQYGPEVGGDDAASPPQQTAISSAAALSQLPTVDRIRRLVRHYAPDREAEVDTILRQAVGHEDKLLQALIKQYGEEPPLAAPPKPQQSAEALRKEITQLIQQKDPDKLGRLPALFQRYANEERRLLLHLQLKYSPEANINMAGQDDGVAHMIPFPSSEPPPHVLQAAKVQEQKALLKRELTTLFSASAPHKLADVEKLTEAFYDEPERILKVMRERFVDVKRADDGTHLLSQQQQQPQILSASSPPASPSSPHTPQQTQAQQEADVKRIVYMRLENLFRTYCPQKLHETSSVLDAWENATGYPTSMFRALYTELRVPEPEQTYHAGLEAVQAGGKVDPSTLLSRTGARRNTILGPAGGGGGGSPYYLNQQRGAGGAGGGGDVESGVGLMAAASPGSISGRGKFLLMLVAARKLLHRDQDGSARAPGDPHADLKSAAAIWGMVQYTGKEVFRSARMVVDIEGSGQWAETDKTNLCALMVNPLEAPLVTLSLFNDAGFFLGEVRLNLQRLPLKSQHSFPLRPRVDERDSTILNVAMRDGGVGLGELEVKWSFAAEKAASQGGSAALGAGVGSTLGIASENKDEQLAALASIKPTLDPIRPRVRAFFSRYIPEHLHETAAVLEEYRGRASELLDALTVRFGPEPDPMAFQSRVERIFCEHDPGRVVEARQIAQKSAGKEEFVIKTLLKRYNLTAEPAPGYSLPPTGGSAPHPPSDPSRIRLTRWLMLRLPRRVGEIDHLLNKFERRENILFRLLAQTTGPEPTDEQPKQSLRSRTLATPALREYFAKRQAPLFLRWMWTGETQDKGQSDRTVGPYHSKHEQWKARLSAFYSHYSPIKLHEVEETLRRWRGKEDILIQALVHKYGPEPNLEIQGRAGEKSSSSATIGQQQQQQQQQQQGHLLAASQRDVLQTQQSRTTPRQALQSFYSRQNPSKLPDVDRLLERFSGRENALFQLLEQKYNVSLDGSPRDGGAAASGGGHYNGGNNSSGGGPDMLSSPTRERVVRRPPGLSVGGGGGRVDPTAMSFADNAEI